MGDNSHPTGDDLHRYSAADNLPSSQRKQIASHILLCENCFSVVKQREELHALKAMTSAMPAAKAGPATETYKFKAG